MVFNIRVIVNCVAVSLRMLPLALTATFLLLSIASADQKDVYGQLKHAQQEINNKTQAFCYHAHSGTKQAFTSNRYQEYIKQLNVLVYPFCLTTMELGNRLGNYFNEITCAEASGIHFMAIHPKWELDGSFHGNHSSRSRDSQLAFLRALPDVIVHPNPVDHFRAVDNVNHHCKCTRYCWQYKGPWVNHTQSIGKYVRKAAQAYLDALGPDTVTVIDPEVDLTNSKSTDKLPLIPDTTIHYRCGDNIAFNYQYGILPFTIFDSRVPKDSKLIYVLSDHPNRAPHSPYTSRCKLILENLFDYLKTKFPSATIVVKRGGDIFLDYARIALSKTVICSASSYCFWPAVSSVGQAYFPLTSLIADADQVALAPTFGPNFHWITDAKLISNFKGLRPWTKIIDVLKGQMEFP